MKKARQFAYNFLSLIEGVTIIETYDTHIFWFMLVIWLITGFVAITDKDY